MKSFVEAMMVAQWSAEFSKSMNQNLVRTRDINAGTRNLNGFVNKVKAGVEEEGSCLIAVGKFDVSNKLSGHALLCYDVEEATDSVRLLVYDCNYPGDASHTLTVRRNNAGNYTAWQYNLGGVNGVWGTHMDNSALSCVPYSVLLGIWQNRGKLNSNTCLMSVNSQNVSIVSITGDEVAKIENGELVTESEDVFAVPSLDMIPSSDSLFYLPEDFYTVTDYDNTPSFEVSMCTADLGAEVATSSSSVFIALDSTDGYNYVSLPEATIGSSYSVDMSGGKNTVSVSGIGIGQTIEVTNSRSAGISIAGSGTIGSLMINGEEQITHTYTISAFAGKGGSINPAGDSTIVAGGSLEYQIECEPGYIISDVLMDGKSIGAQSVVNFSAVKADHTISVSFRKAGGIVSAQLTDNLSLTVKGECSTDAFLVVSVYAPDGQMKCVSSIADINQGEFSKTLSFSTTPTGGDKIKVFLVSKNTFAPLSEMTVINVK